MITFTPSGIDDMPRSKATTSSKSNAKPRYHHGNLVEALVSATVEIVEEGGVESVSVREAARRAGVSPGAPFRHFKTKTALMTAVAEQAMDRLKSSIAATRDKNDDEDPIASFESIGIGYLSWALANPIHFAIISSRTLIDFSASERLQHDNEEIRRMMVNLLVQARDRNQLASDIDLEQFVITARALVYGLARMAVDGHFPEWYRKGPPIDAMRSSLRFLMQRLRKQEITQSGSS